MLVYRIIIEYRSKIRAPAGKGHRERGRERETITTERHEFGHLVAIVSSGVAALQPAGVKNRSTYVEEAKEVRKPRMKAGARGMRWRYPEARGM